MRQSAKYAAIAYSRFFDMPIYTVNLCWYWHCCHLSHDFLRLIGHQDPNSQWNWQPC